VTYVRIRSWHIATFTDRGGALRTRCGRRARVEGTIAAGPGGPVTVSPTSDTLPVNERTCERCFVLSRSDEDHSLVEDDPVGEPPAEDDPVPG
jgi:hypothetical protein